MLVKDVLAQVNKITVDQPDQVKIVELGPLIQSGITIAIIVAAILTFAFLVWGGIQWITSGGDKAKYEEARNRITAALIGLAIVALAWLLIKLVTYFFGIDDPFGGSIDIPKGY
jgi:amino acid transporter